MNPHLNYSTIKQRIADLSRGGKRAKVATYGQNNGDSHRSVTIRPSTHADFASIRMIAELDSQQPPNPPFLVAEADGEIVAALAIEPGIIVANPFRHTAHVVALLRLRAQQSAVTVRPERTALRRLRIGRALPEPR